jgi:hypothetical protein
MNEECGTHVKNQGTHIILFEIENLHGRSHMGDLDVDR